MFSFSFIFSASKHFSLKPIQTKTLSFSLCSYIHVVLRTPATKTTTRTRRRRRRRWILQTSEQESRQERSCEAWEAKAPPGSHRGHRRCFRWRIRSPTITATFQFWTSSRRLLPILGSGQRLASWLSHWRTNTCWCRVTRWGSAPKGRPHSWLWGREDSLCSAWNDISLYFLHCLVAKKVRENRKEKKIFFYFDF